MPKRKGPPAWIEKVVKHVRHCMETDQPPQWIAFMHEDGVAWHLDVHPTTIVEDGEIRWYSFEVDLTELLSEFERGRVKKRHPHVSVTPDAIDIGAFYRGHELHLVIHYDPPDDQTADKKPPLSMLPPLGGHKNKPSTLN